MKVLTLTQPYATLVAIRVKRLETRSWRTGYRGPLAIHAAQGLKPVGGFLGFKKLCWSEPFRTALKQGGAWPEDTDLPPLPLGAIVAICELRDVRIIGVELNGVPTIAADDMLTATPIQGNELAFGNYAAGRYAWLLANVRALPEPIRVPGQLGLWEYKGELPQGVES